MKWYRGEKCLNTHKNKLMPLWQRKQQMLQKDYLMKIFLNAKVTAEALTVELRGNTKRFGNSTQKWEDEFSKKAKLSAEELAKQQLEEQMNVISK